MLGVRIPPGLPINKEVFMESVDRYIALVFVLFGLLVSFIFSKLLGQVVFAFDWYDYQIISQKFTLTTLIGICMGAGTAFYCFRHTKVRTLSQEIAVEIKRVTWPSKDETYVATIVVIVVTLIVSAMLWFFDQLWIFLTNLVYR